jgi:type IV pilus assembly protein PilF
MYTIDERLKGLPAMKEQVVQLYQSLNQPHLAIPGRRAGPASASVLGLRGPSGFAVFVYLALPESGECAVYVPANGTVPADRYLAEEALALGFVESMGFMMDDLGFRGRSPEEQEALIRSLPVFQREPAPPMAVRKHLAPAGGGGAAPGTEALQVGRLLSAFALSLIASGCSHLVSAESKEQAQTHYDLAVGLIARNAQQAFAETEKALELNPRFAEAWHVKGILLHHGFGRLDEAKVAYDKALALKQPFSEAATNLGNLYMDMKRYDDAIALYDQALNDVLYGAPFIAQANKGWALYRKGDVKGAVEQLKAAVTVNPKYCLGHAQLGQLSSEQGDEDESCKHYRRYKDSCPNAPDANHRVGLCQLREGKRDEAMKSFESCIEKSTNLDLKELCLKLKEKG